MKLEEIIARAAPPPERADPRHFEPVATDPDSLARRHAGLLEAFGSEAELAAHAEALGLSAAAWRDRFRDARLVGPPPDWAQTFLAVHECLREAPARFGAELDGWMRAELEAGWPAGLPRAPEALDGPLGYLRTRMDNIAAGSMHAERQLGFRLAWPERFRRYPALAYIFGRVLSDWRADLLRIAGRAAADRALLARELFAGEDPGELRGFQLGLGDLHAGGRSVAFLDFARGRVVYKPKDLRIVGLVGELARALDMPGVEATEIVLRDGYAWEPVYEARPLAAPGDAADFYRALGGWQALLQVLGGNDFWFDNLLADGATPRFIDYETAVQPEIPWPAGVNRPLGDAAGKMQLLPSGAGIMPYLWAVRDGIDPTDIGCLARPGRHRSPMADVERGGMFSWEADAFAPREADGAPQDAADHYAAFEAGHDRAAAVLAAPEFRARAEALLRRYADAPARSIRIDTWSCYRCINRSCAPPRIADSVWREIDFHYILRSWPDVRGAAREAAARDLRRLDVPLYQVLLGGRDLLGMGGERIAGFFERDAIAATDRRLRDFAALDDDERRALLRTSFSLRLGNPPRRSPSPAADAAPAADLLDWAGEIAAFVARLAMRDEHGAPCWLGLVENVHTGVRLLGALTHNVLSGRAGLAWALRDLAGPLGRPELAVLAREALAGAARDYLGSLDYWESDGAGFGTGGGGLVLALAGDEELRPLALEVHDAAAARQLWLRSGADYVSGLEGWRVAARALGRPEPERHGPARPYAPSCLPRLAHWLEADGPERPRTAPLCADRRAAAARRRDRDRHGSWFAAGWLDDRHNLSGVDGLPALALEFARLAQAA